MESAKDRELALEENRDDALEREEDRDRDEDLADSRGANEENRLPLAEDLAEGLAGALRLAKAITDLVIQFLIQVVCGNRR